MALACQRKIAAGCLSLTSRPARRAPDLGSLSWDALLKSTAARSSCAMPPRKFRANGGPGCGCGLPPPAKPTPPSQKSKRAKASSTRAAEILIVDDEADTRDLVAGILQDEGYTTRTARNSDDALSEIATRRPSLVFLDIWLQGSKLDGLQLLDS